MISHKIPVISRRKRQDSALTSEGELHCQCCGEITKKQDMVSICIHCAQAKFIPRGQWEDVGFTGALAGYTDRGWWDKIVCNMCDRIKEAVKRKQEESLGRKVWFDDDEEELED